jgi:hypothetical protein
LESDEESEKDGTDGLSLDVEMELETEGTEGMGDEPAEEIEVW